MSDDAIPELAVIIPVYNEAAIIDTVLEDWIQVLDQLGCDYRIHVYDDGSTDDSAAVLAAAAKRHRQLEIHSRSNGGHGPTVLQGYKENNGPEWIFQVDADNEVPSASFPEFWECRDQYDFIIGRRLGETRPLIRRIMSVGARTIVRLVFGAGVHDANCPFRLMRSGRFRDMFGRIPDDTFSPNLLISGYAMSTDTRCRELEIPYCKRKTGAVSIRKLKLVRAIISSVIETIRIRRHL